MRLATYNVEWFDALSDDQGQMLDDGGGCHRICGKGGRSGGFGIRSTTRPAGRTMTCAMPC